MEIGALGCTVAFAGRNFAQLPPVGTVKKLPPKVIALACGLEIIKVCDPGLLPGAPMKINPVGRISAPGLLPAGSTFNTTETDCGEFGAPGAVT